MEDLSGTAHVVLGMLGLGAMSGYDIKNFIDISTRHFWSVSYGQLYPELNRLEAAGLIRSDQPEGGRRRTVYRLTEKGDQALVSWLTSAGSDDMDLRDELLLKLFFADRLPASEARRLLVSMQERHRRLLDSLRATEATAEHAPMSHPYLVLRFGIEFHEWVIAWVDKHLAEVNEDDVREARAADQ
jgi:DNA-binding PadR family transcriptional regulator